MPEYDRLPKRDRGEVIAEAVMGAVAGAVGVWVLDRVDWYLYDHENPDTRRLTRSVRPGGLDPAHVMANRAANALGISLSPRQPHPAGMVVHYALGVVPASLYGALLDDLPALGTGRGSLYGLSVFLLHDEVLNPALGLAARPGRYPWQDHARGFAAHLVYGMVTDAVLRVLKGSRPTRQRWPDPYAYRRYPPRR